MKIPLLSFWWTRLLNKLILMKSSWQIPLKWKMPGSEKHYGRNTEIPWADIGQKTYIVRALLVGIPTAAMFAFTWIRPELFVGDANIFILSFMVLGTLGFVSLISLAIRRLSDIGLSHLYYWGFFGFLFVSNQAGAKLLSDELLATRITGMFFFAAVTLLAFIPGQKTKNKYGPVPK